MDFFCFLAAFLLLLRLRREIRFSQLSIKWGRMLLFGSFAIVGLYFFFHEFFDDDISNIVAGFLLVGLITYLRKEPDFKAFDILLFAHYPLAIVAIFNGFTELAFSKFYAENDDYFQIAQLVAFGWIFARLSTSKKQREEIKRVNERRSELEALVAERTVELTQQKNELQETIKELQATQAQLIQQEKLASLGELTAGIAHEIQNPLNFVNNFSEVSMELIDEMQEELTKGDTEEVLAIASDIKQNLEKIRHHGKRADGIVKGMLQHSRASSNVKEPTNINTIADEYFRLAYHGLRAKDKSFNAELIANLDAELPMANIVSQDVGRVLLNMFTNAFYAVHERKKTAGPEFKPVVEVSTRQVASAIEVRIKDNGTGIPDSIKDKIMQPFFTTKPAGEGTGLGLSLSYDIIVKAHKGTININSAEGQGTEFVITLPLK
ncbi:histidine kinase [Mucilaginibacter pallidiroseus]|uniref:histidine kinase n=1 Tax=Mucilaginibacter pallidiroseus TaxID=2599295 RepID=A0A563UCH6_9SPHI|nr:ATP-binding protein [Mucilaginibacter pallidiroseus]TWR28959.1 histidine kinase [Mucilaginibacter pallidiroseus]